MADFWWNFSYR